MGQTEGQERLYNEAHLRNANEVWNTRIILWRRRKCGCIAIFVTCDHFVVVLTQGYTISNFISKCRVICPSHYMVGLQPSSFITSRPATTVLVSSINLFSPIFVYRVLIPSFHKGSLLPSSIKTKAVFCSLVKLSSLPLILAGLLF